MTDKVVKIEFELIYAKRKTTGFKGILPHASQLNYVHIIEQVSTHV
jgi:hypothetical protein